MKDKGVESEIMEAAEGSVRMGEQRVRQICQRCKHERTFLLSKFVAYSIED